MVEPFSIGTYYPDSFEQQVPSDVAVIMATVLRPDIIEALTSVYRQSFKGRIQLAIGVDVAQQEIGLLSGVIGERPSHVSVLLVHLPFSTSIRHGGVHLATDGGSLRSVLSLMANSRLVAFLDDDNTWAPRHLSLLHEAIQGKVWACTQRMLVDSETDQDLGVDQWDSVGTDRGRFASIGGFVDPNCLMVEKVKACRALGRWAEPISKRSGQTGDRNFFRAIARSSHTYVMEATVRYRIRPTNVLHKFLKEISVPIVTHDS